MKRHSANTNRSSSYNNISSNIDKGYCNHNRFIDSIFRYLRNHNHNNDYHNHCNHKNYSNHKPLHSISRLLTFPTDTMTLLMATLSLSFVLNFVINVFIPNHTYADDSISLTISNSNLVLSLAPKTVSGEFAESSNATIAVSTTSSNGYTLSIASSTGSTDLANTKDDSSKITSISNTLTNTDFSNPANTQYNNKWGYKPSQYVVVDGNTHTTVANTGNNAVFKPLPNTSGEILAITDQANASNAPDNYTISMGARANNDTLTGSYVSAPFVITAVANSSALPCDPSKLCVEYDGNGLQFDGELINRVNYNSSSTQQEITKYSRAQYNEDGTYNGYATPAGNNVVTIDGTTSLHIKVTYGVPQNNSGPPSDLYIWAGNHPDYTNANNNTSLTSCGSVSAANGSFHSNSSGSQVTMECDISSSSVTFYDYGQYHVSTGYYAIITGTSVNNTRTVASGEYAAPTGTNAVFNGWSSTRTTSGAGLPSQVEYADESEVKSKLSGNNGEEKFLYAVWQQGQQITFTKDANVSSIDVLNSDGTKAGTITTSGQSLVLAQGSIYTIKTTYTAGYTTNTITKASGEGTISGDVRERQFTVGAGSATINITSRQMLPMQNYSCSNLANVGDTDMVYDTRDNQAYLIGKLKDGNCWLLDNLALDLVAHKNDLSSTNTNASDEILAYLKNGGGSGQYAANEVKAMNKDGSGSWDNSYTDPYIATGYENDIPSDATSQSGQYKIGVYYNFCAASAGSYCYAFSSAPSDEQNGARNIDADICPKGWRMPTGNTSGEYSALANAIYGSTGSTSDSTACANYHNALRLPLSGEFASGSASYQGSYGIFWSSTRVNTTGMFILYFSTSIVNPASVGSRSNGYSVRCVLGS